MPGQPGIHRETLSPKDNGGRSFLWVFSKYVTDVTSCLLHSGQTTGQVLLDTDIIVDKDTETWEQLPY